MDNSFVDSSFIWNLFGGILFGSLVAVFSKKLQFLTFDGAISAFFIGIVIFSFGLWKWAIPIIVFFVFSSILSKIGKNQKEISNDYSEKGSQRDAFQVLANGGLAGCLAIFEYVYHSELFYLFYVSFLAAVCADTWSSEIGTYFQGKTYNILSFEKVEPGVSGGVSFYGTLGGIAGSLIISLSTLPWVKFNHLYYICLISFAGLLGNFIDSIIGSLVQAQYKCKSCGKISEKKYHCKEKSILIKGNRFVTNSAVNFTAGTASGIIGIIILDIL